MSKILMKIFESPNQYTTYQMYTMWLNENQYKVEIVDKSETYRTKENYIYTIWYKEIELN